MAANKSVSYCSKNNGCIINVVSGGSDPNNDPVSLDTTYSSSLVHGISVSSVPGDAASLNFLPQAGFSGVASFTYRLTDALGNPPGQALTSAPGVVYVTVVNDPPTISTNTRTFDVKHGSTVSLSDLLQGSTDPNGDDLFVSRVSASEFADVTISISADQKNIIYSSTVPHAQ